MMFGYWAGIWVHLNKIDQTNEDNPFREFVKLARKEAENEPGNYQGDNASR